MENVKWTQEVVDDVKATYVANPTRETVEELAFKYGRSVRSIAGKLSREGVYIRPTYVTKQGEVPHTKDKLVEYIAEALGCDSLRLDGLEKAPKQALRLILEALDEETFLSLKAK